MIKDKFILGTFHFCLLPEERNRIDLQRSEDVRRIKWQQSMVASGQLSLRNLGKTTNHKLSIGQ
jgi:hypothetical protein